MIAVDHKDNFSDLGAAADLPDYDRRRLLAILASVPVFAAGAYAAVNADGSGAGGDGASVVSDKVTVVTGSSSTPVESMATETQAVATPAAAPMASRASLFSAQSPWNSSPIKPRLGVYTLPTAKQIPWIEEGAYSSKIFRAAANDSPMTVIADDIANQLEAGAVTIPRFPAATMPATGQDGHCEILDPVDGTLHSFYQLRRTAGTWRAGKYARSSAQGSGWGTVSNPDNVRAAGCSTAGGLLLASELGLDIVPHALAIGMDKNAFLPGPVWPATLQDYNGASTYKGTFGHRFPMGRLLMLPADFDVDKLGLPESRTIARTLKKYGGYIVDATVGSLNFYAETGSGWNKSYVNGRYSAAFGPDMEAIKASLRQLMVHSGFLDRDGKPYTPTPFRSMNLLSMRGPWQSYNGSKSFGKYDAATDLFQAEATTDPRTIRQLLNTHDESDLFGYKKLNWNLNPEPGVRYFVRAIGAGDIMATLAVNSKSFKRYGATAKLTPGSSVAFTWPTDPATVTEIFVDKPAGAAASIRLELVKV